MAGILRTDTIQNSNTSTIITQTNSTTITIGTTGQTVALAAGASQSGFGRAGSVNWDTTAKTTGFTAVSGNGYFCDTTSSAFTVTLPATPAAGDIVAIADYANTSATNNITVGRNGSLIDGGTIDAKIKINGQVYTLVYVDATEGWKTVSQTFNQISTAEFVAATGGCIATCGNYKIHTFTGPGTFTVTSAGNAGGSNSVDYLVVAGGGSGGHGTNGGGGGGAGGYRESVPSPAAWTASPLANPGGALPVSVQGYPITVGGGGPGVANPNIGIQGTPSVFSTITSTGGGGGGRWSSGGQTTGGSGGGSAQPNGTGGVGNTPPTSPSQGNNGGNLGFWQMGGGGGAGAGGTPGHSPCGSCGGSSSNRNGKGGGGNGVATFISGTSVTRAGGGGGGFSCAPSLSPASNYAPGGTGGGANGGPSTQNGTANTGGGGGGSPMPNPAPSGSGGSGVVVIRYKFQ